MSPPHALVLPYPAQGHVIPLMELSQRLAAHGFDITFVNTDFNHGLVTAALQRASGEAAGTGRIRLESVPDGLGPDEDRKDLGRLTDGFQKAMPGALEELIRRINDAGGERKLTCMIADCNMAWVLPMAKRLGLRVAAFWPASTAMLLTMLSIPKFIEDGILDANGLPRTHGKLFEQQPGMPPVDTSQLAWNLAGSSAATQQIIFRFVYNNNRSLDLAESVVCNSFDELEPAALSYDPSKLLPVGPLLPAPGGQQQRVGSFWPEDGSCMDWLDAQPANSVLYVAFGSFTVFDHSQFRELALGLELSGRPFLWVVRPDLTDELSNAYPEGFEERVAARGRMIGWAPQNKVLAHPSVACFLSHCGWNSTIEGVWNGLPFICWPYFTDQFLNRNYICDVWKIGLGLVSDESGIISRREISGKVEQLLADGEIRSRALEFKARARKSVSENGSSFHNLNKFIHDISKQI